MACTTLYATSKNLTWPVCSTYGCVRNSDLTRRLSAASHTLTDVHTCSQQSHCRSHASCLTYGNCVGLDSPANRVVQVDRYKQLLLKQRDIMIALTGRLNERDEQILTLQEELEAYDAHQK